MVVRRGRRAGRPRLVVHALLQTASPAGNSGGVLMTPTQAEATAARVGFVVSKAVGNAVIRHRVTRRLRHLMRARLGTLPSGYALVVRALPPAATSSSGELGADLDDALRRLGFARAGQTMPRGAVSVPPHPSRTTIEHGDVM